MKLEIAMLAALPAVLGGCANSEWFIAVNGSGIVVRVRTPGEVLASHARALEEQDVDAYLALLTPDFRFYVRDDDAADIPWLSEGPWGGSSWGLEDETRIVANLMDPDFDGDARPVETLVFDYAPPREWTAPDGTEGLTVNAQVKVLLAPGGGWLADTRLEFRCVRDSEGFVRIREIRETSLVRSEDTTFGKIKANYWTP